MAEIAGRREGFSEGRAFVGADGADWVLPVVDSTAWDRFPAVRRYFRLILDHHPGGTPPDQAWRIAVEVLSDLLCANYEITLENSAGLVQHGGVRSSGAMDAAILSLGDGEVGLMALCCLDARGLGRELAGACELATIAGVAPLGMLEHDGRFFSN